MLQNQELMYSFIGIFVGMGLYELLKAIADKIRHRAFVEELKNFTKNKFIKSGFKITIEKDDNITPA